MNKKIIIGVLTVIIIAIIGMYSYSFINSNKNINETNSSNDYSKDNKSDNKITSDGKMLVAYFSATGSTKKVAEELAKNLNADLFEIEPVDAYTSDDLNWSDNNSRVSKEHNDESLRNIKLKNTKVSNWDNYDTVLIGYPIWWGIAAWPVNNFVKDNDFTGKTVIPFCTSSSSGLGQSGELLEKMAKGGTWEEGHRFSSGAPTSEIKKWTDSLK